MDQDSKNQTLEGLTKSENIVIVVAKDLAFDGLAAGLALYLSLAKLGKKVIILAKEPQVADAQKIYGVNHIGETNGVKNPVIVISNAPQTVDKVTYFLDGDSLKVIVHPLAQGGGVTKDQISLEYTNAPIELIFAIGFPNLEKLRSEITHEYIIDSNTRIISIDKQEPDQKYTQSNFIDPAAASVAEITAKLIQDLALPIDEDIAYNLYTAIAQSTQNFSPAATSATALEIASWLLKFGAGHASLAKQESRRASLAQKGQTTSDYSIPQEELSSKGLPQLSSVLNDTSNWLKPPKIYKGSKSFDKEN